MNWIPAPLLRAYRRVHYKRQLDLPRDASDEALWHACLNKANVGTAQALVKDGLIPRTRHGTDARQKLLHEWLDGLVAQSIYTMGPSLGLLRPILATGADPYVRPCWKDAPVNPALRDKRSFLDRLVDEAPGRTLLQVVATKALQWNGQAADGTPHVFKIIHRNGNPKVSWDVVSSLLHQGLSVAQCDSQGRNLITEAFQEGPDAFNMVKAWVERLG